MRSSVSSWLSSRQGLGITLLSLGLFLILGVTACSDSVAPSSPDTASEQSTNPATTTKQKTADDVYTEVAQKPDCGGIQALAEKIQYPELAQEAGIEGQVFVQFIVDKTGAVVEPTIQKGDHEMLNKAALSAVKRLECKPGRQQSEPVKVQMTVPVTFRLDDEPENGSTGSSKSAGTSSQTTKNDAGGRLFEKAGIQVVRVLLNEEGDLLIGDDLVEFANLTDAVRQRITQDAARVALLYADGAPTDRVDAAEATLRALDLQRVHVQKVE
jgi:TonB family protein